MKLIRLIASLWKKRAIVTLDEIKRSIKSGEIKSDTVVIEKGSLTPTSGGLIPIPFSRVEYSFIL